MGYPLGLLYKVVGWFIELVYTPTYEISTTTYQRFEGEHSLVHSDICGHTHLLVCLSWHLSAVSWSALYLVGPRRLTSHPTPPHPLSCSKCMCACVCVPFLLCKCQGTLTSHPTPPHPVVLECVSEWWFGAGMCTWVRMCKWVKFGMCK